MIRPAAPSDTADLIALAVSTGLFSPEEADSLLKGVLDDIHAGRRGEEHVAHVWTAGRDSVPKGWVYFAPDATADGVWELWWIGVAPNHHGQGIGDELLRHVEAYVRAERGRLLLIETSSLPKLERTRRFYVNRSYVACGQVPDFYGEGDAKIIFVKRLAEAALTPTKTG